jgi:RNA recognition motif-containing protein
MSQQGSHVSNGGDNTQNLPFKRIKILRLPSDVTRAHLEELGSKFGKITGIEIERAGRYECVGFITFATFHDAEYALYRLIDTIYLGNQIRVFSSPITTEELERKKKEQQDRRTQSIGDNGKKKKRY